MYVFDAQLNGCKRTIISFVTLRSLCKHDLHETCPKNFNQLYQVAIDHAFQIVFSNRIALLYLAGYYCYWLAFLAVYYPAYREHRTRR